MYRKQRDIVPLLNPEYEVLVTLHHEYLFLAGGAVAALDEFFSKKCAQ